MLYALYVEIYLWMYIWYLLSLNDPNIFLQVQRGIPVIPNSINSTQIQANFNIFDFQLKYDEMALIDSIDNSTDAKKSFRIHHRNGSFSHSPYYPFHEEFWATIFSKRDT